MNMITKTRRDLAVVIVGLHSSGKSTLAKGLASAANLRIFELGDGVREAARKSATHNLVQLAGALMGDDPLYLPRLAVQRAGQDLRRSIFVGPRTAAEFDYLASALTDPLTLGLKATTEYRYRRWRHRHLRYDDTWEQRECYEQQWGTSRLIDRCDIVLDASEDLTRKLSIVNAELADRTGRLL
jgi:adenylate kinase family enzyme